MDSLDKDSLPEAVATLFRLNNYTVEGPVQVHGAEIDLVATPIGDPFGAKVYIEATVEHVDNDKYGKDVGKLAMVHEIDPAARRLIVSLKGFSLPVKERAAASRIDTLTYRELFAAFERFDPYVRAVLDEGPEAEQLTQLQSVYEHPRFVDRHGNDSASAWLDEWHQSPNPPQRWVVIVGEYGSGKTALTKMAQRRWVESYRGDPNLPIPFRLELRDFTRQFDATGLLHHFLDHNGLAHVPIDFVWSLIRGGRVVLLLDGYDEMAQYLSARERRVCLEALAHLSAGGAKGVITSRPNYFSEAEEFQLFDTLYRAIEVRSPYIAASVAALAKEEEELDQLIEHQFLQRYERTLQDLTPDQTETLVRRVLGGDAKGAAVVIGILDRVFRSNEEGSAVSLSGKPVIISYLLEVVDQLKDLPGSASGALTEWDVYTLVIDQLMLRDLRQAGRILPKQRRKFLQVLALHLSQKEHSVLGEDEFRDLVRREFRQDLRRYGTAQRQAETENYFEDMRRSGTLTRSADPLRPGWRFSHNSLREFLLSEYLLEALERGDPVSAQVPVTDAMRQFVASLPSERVVALSARLTTVWGGRASNRGVGAALELLWEALLQLQSSTPEPALAALATLSASPFALDDLSLSRLIISTTEKPCHLDGAKFSGCDLSDVVLAGAGLVGARFDDCLLDSVVFADADLSRATFTNAALLDVDLSRATLTGADCRSLDEESSILVETPESGLLPVRLHGPEALGYLKFHGARTDDVASFHVLRNHKNFPIVDKVCAKFAEHSPRQRLGIEQRGAAVRDVPFARRFVAHLESEGLVQVQGGRSDLLFVTSEGRDAFTEFCASRRLPESIERFLLSEL